ncbi:uncharacterized protein LOC139912094 isoform X2 [Centroberyx gerrardi]|uniref:uncharacterized protein isoform X2 n=1 Tax=Centroberyx gerrardi TaxID=166262 RepID=UPI003AABEF9D
MSSRDSLGTGDLIPQDVVEVFAQERLTKRGRKKRSNSLGRALGWLKGKKRKDVNANGQSLGLGPGLDLALDGHPAGHQGGNKGAQKAGKQAGRQAGKQAGKQAHQQGNSHAVPKQEDGEKALVPPLFQENVFIEASRPKYLEDLHTEAQEGLKLMQQEETNNGVDYKDDESSISMMTVQPEEDGGGFMSDSTIASSTVSTQSTVSTRSSRSGLTRQGSTFRPLNSGKKPEKAKTRRRNRKTVTGIPHHVQRELGLDRIGWTMNPMVDEEQLPNGETVDIPTIVGPHQAAEPQEGSSVSPQDMEVLQPLSEGQVQQFNATQAGHKDDLALLQRLGPDLSALQRPRSLAVPWMTTANSLEQQPPSPVMSMSPQATYLSKIIPNAVMPPSIEVVEISRGRSRSSLRTVSKSSLLLASPASSRASSRASSSRGSTLSSASRHRPPHLSDSSCWSHSDSSETLVSDSSTISSSSTPRQGRSQDGDVEGSAKEDKISVYSSVSKASKSTSNGKPRTKGDEVNKEAAFARSLSVMKSKRAPPPPSRSYSLHNKMKRRSRDLAEARMITGKSSPQSMSASGEENDGMENKPGQIKEARSSPMSSRTIDSPGYTADTSSLDDSTGSVAVSPIKSHLQAPEKENSVKAEEPVAKDTSPEKQQPPQEKELKKIVSPSSGYSSQDGTPTQPSKQPHSSSPRHKRGILAKLQSLFPGSSSAPTVLAPSPLTQPETPENTKSTEPAQPQPNPPVDTVIASPSVRALRELFNIPPPPKVHAPPPPPPEVWAHNKRTFELLLGPPAPNDTYAVVRKNPKDRRQQRQSPSISREGSVKNLSGERKQKNQTFPVESTNGSLYVVETRKVQESECLNPEVHKENNERLAHVEQHVDVKGNGKVTEKDEKVRVSELLNGMLVKAVEKRGERLAAMQQEEAKMATHTHTSVTEVKTKMDTLSAVSLVRVSPAPSPPPAHHPPQPPTKQTTHLGTPNAASAAAPQPSVSPTSESSWPPPPPPMEQASGTLNRPDEMDFPLPPPPVLSEEGLVIPVEVPPKQSIPKSNSEQLDSTRTTTSVTSVVNTECFRVATEAAALKPSEEKPTTCFASVEVVSAPQKTPPAPQLVASVSQGIPPPPMSIPPPPPYAAPPAPVKEVSPPPVKEVSPLPPKEISPPLVKEVSLAPVKEVSPPPVKEVSPLPPKEISPPLVKEVSPAPVKEVSPPPVKEVSPAPAKEISPPPVKEVSPPSVKEVSPPLVKEISPPPVKEVSPPPVKEVSPPPVKEVSPPPVKEVSPPLVKEVSPPPVKEVSPSPPKEVSPPLPKDVSPLSAKEVAPPPSQEATTSPLSILSPPQEPTPPPPQQSEPLPSVQEVNLPPKSIPPLSETIPPSLKSTLSPPESIPPPPPSELHPSQVVLADTDGSHPAAQELPPPPSEIPIPPPLETSPAPQVAQEHAPSPPVNIPLPPPLPVQAPVNIKHQPSPVSTETESQVQTSSPALQKEPTPVVTPSLLQMVKLRSVNSSPEPTKPQDQTQPEVTMRTQQPSNPVTSPSASGEAPQKPIRRSLIMTSPTCTSPPAVVTSQPAVPKSQATMVLPTSSSTVSPTKKSPPATITSPSMNLQEAIRLRTAARTKDAPPSRLSLHSPLSPLGGDLHKSPSSTASFIFSKSTKKVVIETTPLPDGKANFQKNVVAELSSVTKSVNEAESLKKGVKVPPPVAKKPKAKAKEMESSGETEQMQTAGQEAQPESIKDTPEEPNGTAGSAEGGQTSST